jgi:biotin transport system substrate-specific component
MTYKTLSDLVRPRSFSFGRLYDIFLMIAGIVCLTLSAYIRIPLPFTPVPLTAQTLTVLLIGVLYGSKRGVLCTVLYIVVGIAGLPVFQGGHFGLAYIIKGTTAGYLFGFIAAASVTGYLAEQGFDRSFWKSFVAMCIGNIIILTCGCVWLAAVGLKNVIVIGALPFILGDLVKIFLASIILPAGWKMINRADRK